MRKRTVAFLVLAPVGVLLGVGLFRMIQHDWAVREPVAKEEPTRSQRPAQADDRPHGPSGSAVSDEMRRLYNKGSRRVPPGEELEEFTKLAGTLESRHVSGLIEELEKSVPAAAARDEFLLPLYARWAELEPLRAWEQVRREGYEAKEGAERAWAVRRMAAILEVWSARDAALALAAYLEVERGAEALRLAPEWWPAMHAVFANAAKSLGDKTPESLRGMVSHRDHAIALGHWASSRFLAGGDPADLAKRIDDEAVAAMQRTGADEERLQAFRAEADQRMAGAWFERDPEAAMAWLDQRHGAAGVMAFLAGYADRLEPATFAEREDRVRQFLLSRPGETRDGWIGAWLEKTHGADLGLVADLASEELRFESLRKAAWPKVAAEEGQQFEPWACDPAEVRRVMDEVQLDEARRAEIEEILSVR